MWAVGSDRWFCPAQPLRPGSRARCKPGPHLPSSLAPAPLVSETSCHKLPPALPPPTPIFLTRVVNQSLQLPGWILK